MTRIIFEDDAAWQTHLDEIEDAKADAWDDGYYFATNGKWGLPDPGDNPHRRASSDAGDS